VTKKNASGWVEVAAVGKDEQATLVAGMLQAAGIPVQVEGPAVHPLPENLGSFGMSRIMVPSDQEEEARSLIASRERGDPDSVLTDEDVEE
jgi:Putative prokaryotic signal transducing protein